MKTVGMLGMGKLGLPCLMAMEAKRLLSHRLRTLTQSLGDT